MQSRRKSKAIIGRDVARESKEETAVVEIDTTFAKTIGLLDYQKVNHPFYLLSQS